MDVQEIGWGNTDWFYLLQGDVHVADSYERGNEQSGSIKRGNFFTRRTIVAASVV
jgi:hypothetical protein